MTLLTKWKDEGSLSSESFEKLTKFVDLLIHWNSRFNLTGLKTREDIEEFLIGESLLALRVFPLSNKKVLDVGSGAGVPGLIWAIVEPSILLTSVEIRAKKITFQKHVARELGLSVEILQGSFPFVVRDRKFDVIATRAVRIDDAMMKSVLSLLNKGGVVLRFASGHQESGGWKVLPLSERSALHLFSRTS